MGNSLLFEENHLIGFLPLKSYFDTKKQVGAGIKCPADKEDLMRCLLFRDALEQLKCTYADLKPTLSASATSNNNEGDLEE